MIYSLKEYQRETVDELKQYLLMYLNASTRKQIVLKAPTGSGKTYMASSLFEEFTQENSSLNFCVIWACPGKGELHKQSFNAVKSYLGGNPTCSLLEDDFFGSRKYIKNKEIVFINWEKLIQKDKETGNWANNLMKDQEGMNFIDVIDTTKTNGTKIVLIVDESHIGSSHKARIQEFKETIIIPQVTIEMSATPLSEHIDVTVDPAKVIEEGMIKEDVIVNEGIVRKDLSLQEIDSETLVLDKGYNKRLQLVEEYKKCNANVNPLVLIQIPNVDEGEAKKILIREYLRDKGITEDNGKLKFWCADKSNFDKKAIRQNNDITEFLVFKTAVATGWDCPRAHVLVKFRDGKSEIFETQTIGRILRTAEAKSYDNLILDNAYIFTNLATFERRADTYNPNKIKTEFAKFKDGYTVDKVFNQTQLESFYRSRQGDYNAADSRFMSYFKNKFKSFFEFNEDDEVLGAINIQNKFIAKGFNLDLTALDSVIEETIIGSKLIDEEGTSDSDVVRVAMSDSDIQFKFNSIIRENLNGLAYVRSKSPVTQAILDCFYTYYNVFTRSERVQNIMKLVVKNTSIISQILSSATLEFRTLLAQEAGKKGVNYDFRIEDCRAYSIETHTTMIAPKSLYQPLYVLKDDQGNPDNQLEKDFLDYLGDSNEVEWFWENGTELMKTNFGISYNNGMNTFQPDFIVKFKNGTVGIFDTKPVDYRADDTALKSNALHNYLKRINYNRGYAPRVIGGIVIKHGSQFYLYDKEDYHTFSEDRTGWKNFSDVLRDVRLDMLNKEFEH